VGQSHILAKGGLLRQSHRGGPCLLHDLLGSARLREDHPCPHHRRRDEIQLCHLFGRTLRCQGNPGRHRGGPAEIERTGRRTILFVDEIHRFNRPSRMPSCPTWRAPHHADRATTENPSFEVISPLLSRTRVMVLRPFTEEELAEILRRALRDPRRGLGGLSIEVEPEALDHLVRAADGMRERPSTISRRRHRLWPGRTLRTAPSRWLWPRRPFSARPSSTTRRARALQHHFRPAQEPPGERPDAALYWLARMIEAGEDPLYIARRMIRFASEDIGNADPMALTVAMAAMQAFHFIGLPEASWRWRRRPYTWPRPPRATRSTAPGAG